MSHSVDIGYLEKKEEWKLHPKFFPCKVGGKPSWLDLRNLPMLNDLSCGVCDDPLVFLCQVYAPIEEREDAFHRTLFVFICRNGSCCKPNSANNLVVLRCQLPRANEFYSFEPSPEVENEEFPMNHYQNLCYICGGKAPSHCARCKKTFYCSRKHQVLHWQKGHKQECDLLQQDTEPAPDVNFKVTDASKALLFDQWELIVDQEDEEEDCEVDVQKEMEKLQRLVERSASMNAVSDEELQQYTRQLPEDKVFSKFSARVGRHPEQVVRYERAGRPLWITGAAAAAAADRAAASDSVAAAAAAADSAGDAPVPPCQYCGAERIFEFQIMPQLLNYIGAGVAADCLDWGVIAVYTCRASCAQPPAYKREHAVKQDLLN